MPRLSSRVFLLALAAASTAIAAAESREERREHAARAFGLKNFKDAHDDYRVLALDPGEDPARAGESLTKAIACLEALSREGEIDPLRDSAIAAHNGQWRFLLKAAQTLADGNHWGRLVGGKFVRRGSRGRSGNGFERDRVLALRLLDRALELASGVDDRAGLAELHLATARVLLMTDSGDGIEAGWTSLLLTDLRELPELDEPRVDIESLWDGVPVDVEGRPVFPHRPASYEAARNDGERWRWHVEQCMTLDPSRRNEARLDFANLLHAQFDVSVSAMLGQKGQVVVDEVDGELGPFGVGSLREEETLAPLATGVKRITLPDEFNPLRIYRSIADSDAGTWAEHALDSLAEVFENRRQYVKAAEVWREAITRFGKGKHGVRASRLDQIVASRGAFEPARVQPTGHQATVAFVFRNGRSVRLEAHEVLTSKLIDGARGYLKGLRPGMGLDYSQLQLTQFDPRLLKPEGSRYIGPLVASWDQALEPKAGHLDRRIVLKTPLTKAGTYLLTARMSGSEPCRIVVMLADTMIVRKAAHDGEFFLVSDARTGRPVPNVELEFLGFDTDLRRPTGEITRVETRRSIRTTGRDGHVIVDRKDLDPEFEWLTVARTDSGRLAFLGFQGGSHANRTAFDSQRSRAFITTDRPVYRPGQSVKFKCWVRNPAGDAQAGAGSHVVRFADPGRETVFKRKFTADVTGGFDGELTLPKTAELGTYGITVGAEAEEDPAGSSSFEVEEYRKPEFEVTVQAPRTPPRLGERFTATVRATYGFGSPVGRANLKYRVTRERFRKEWYPKRRWDWLYGEGYGVFARHYAWPPGRRYWRATPTGPPVVGLTDTDVRRLERLELTFDRDDDEREGNFAWEVLGEERGELIDHGQLAIGEDGTAELTIDTARALREFPDVDHRYVIEAEVVDRSRRTVIGTGDVLVAARPFDAFAWLDRGYYRPGEPIVARLEARSLDLTPASVKAKATLLKIAYRDDKPIELAVEHWEFATDMSGQALLMLKAAEPGRYRLAFTMDDGHGHAVERGCVFLVAGDGFNGGDLRFEALELIPDRLESSPGDRVRILVNANRPGATVYVFVRATDGRVGPPRVLRLDGKSTALELEVIESDVPNVFVEGLTIADGRLYRDVVEIRVPPREKSLRVQVTPSFAFYRPGAPARVAVRLTDESGKPFVGSAALSVYDKALDQFAGDRNRPSVQAAFWGRTRAHRADDNSNVGHLFTNLLADGQAGMASLGVFGNGSVWGEPIQYSFSARSNALERDIMGEAERSSAPAERAEIPPQVRRSFADTALWTPSLTTDRDGVAEVGLTMPENLAAWKIRAWAIGGGTEVGEGEAVMLTRKDLLVRLQAPRFLVEGDEVVLSANVHNDRKTDQALRVLLEIDGRVLELLDAPSRRVQIKAGGEERVDWRVRCIAAGEAVIRVKALGGEESDAAEIRIPALVRGQLRTESFAGSISPDRSSARLSFRVPEERRKADSRVEVRFSPTLAGALVDALPYLADYPYGCTEQTLNRFLPTVIAQNVLRRSALDLKAMREARTKLNFQELGGPLPRSRPVRDPVFDEETVGKMAREGMDALASMQLDDGSWGWFSGPGERPDAHLTALVVHGLQTAQASGVAIPIGTLRRGTEWLKNHQIEQVRLLENARRRIEPFRAGADNLDALVFLVLTEGGFAGTEMLPLLDRDRARLSVYGLTLFGLALEKLGRKDLLLPIVHTIEQYLVRDPENQTAHLRLSEGTEPWLWHGSDIETQACYLKLMARTEPKGDTAPALVKYLLNNRRHATHWDSTRDTALCVEAIAEYLKASGEDRPEMTVTIHIDGTLRKTVRIDRENLFGFDNALVLSSDEIEAGEHTIELRRQGRGPVYFHAYVTDFTLEEPIRRTGLEIRVDRKFFRVRSEAVTRPSIGPNGRPATATRLRETREELADRSTLASGDVVEVELTIDSKNDYEYVLVEDRKPAGFEPVALRSGYGNDLGAYMELRDQAVCFFVRRLARGPQSIRYRVRAEAPGRYAALPAAAHAMYAPELRGNSDEARVAVDE